MSRANGILHPNFEWHVQEPPPQYSCSLPASQSSNHISQPWISSRPRSAQPRVRSPATSVASTGTAPVQQRPFDSSVFHQGNAESMDDRSSHNLLDMNLLAPPGHVARSFSPVAQNFNDESWNIFNLRTREACNNRTPFEHNNDSLKTFGHGPGSIGSAAPRSDSGYNSQSVISHDVSRMDQNGMRYNTSQQVDSLKVCSTSSEAPPMFRVSSDQRSQVSRVSDQSSDHGNPLECRVCGVVSKCNSDLKKHQIKHSKIFLCDVARCKRKGQGFGTSNDLERHKKSVHKIGLLEKSYQCAAESCKTKTKIWPRLDNFKQHIERMHKRDDPIELIKKSVFVQRTSKSVTENVFVAPIDTMVAGMEKSLSAHSNYGSALSFHTRTDHPSTQWPANLNPADDSLSFDPYPMAMPSIVPMGDHTRQDPPHDNKHFWGQQRGSIQSNATKISTDAIRKVTPELPAVTRQQKKDEAEISSAPHTKAQQQQSNVQQKRQALTKLSQAVSDEIKDSSSQVDLEQVLLRILAGSHGTEDSGDDKAEDSPCTRNNKVFVTKREAIKAAQMLSSIIKQSPGSAYTQPTRKGTQGFNANTVVCPHCPYAVARPCDLKKHLKRHEKPYGCTYPKCHKRFGAKSDWKRHENSQHFQLEAFRCCQPSPSAMVQCGEYFQRPEHFKKHLVAVHKMDAEDVVADTLRRDRIGKNCQSQFWCGFERKIIRLSETRNAAWDERFDHIAFHFEKEARGIEDWVCVEENRSKRELLKEMDRYVFDDEEEARRKKATTHMNSGQPPPVQDNLLKRRPATEVGQTRSNKKQRTQDEPLEVVGVTVSDSAQSGFAALKRYCCECGDGPNNSVLQAGCMNCGHAYCLKCPYEH